MTIEERKYEAWLIEELQSLLDDHIFNRDRIAETYTDRVDLNKEIRLIKNEIIRREKSE
jgi:hypothetical protein